MTASRLRLLSSAAFVLAFLIAVASAGGILFPATYVHETPNWRAQGIGQDWYNLFVVVPLMVVCGGALLRGARVALVPFAGTLLFTVYTFLIYTMAIHFNAFFLVYCAIFGVSVYALIAVAVGAVGEDARAWTRAQAPMKAGGWFLVVTGGLFGLMWLAEVLPAVATGTPPAALKEVGLVTNPVHVLDLSVFIPASIGVGVSMLRGRRLGVLVGPVLLVFTLVMLLSIAALFVYLHLAGEATNLILAGVLVVVAAISGGLLGRILALGPRTAQAG